jgi:hypothetical protein
MADSEIYRIAGLKVSSEIALPGLIVAPDDRETNEVTIRRSAVPDSLDNATMRQATFEIAGERFLFRIPGLARFLLTEGRDIAFACEDGVPEDDIAIFLIGTVFGILLHQREQIVLHASAIRVNGKAVLFCGPSGAGKSTIAAALGLKGYAMVTDDLCAMAMGPDGVPIVQPDGRQLKLWSQAIDELHLSDRSGQAVRNRLQKFYVEPVEAIMEALPLAAIYVLRETRPPLHDGIERANVVDATLLVRRNAYRPRLVVAMQQRARYFESAATIASAAGIYFLNRPLDFARMPDVIAGLEQHWSKLGLSERAV